MQVLEKTYLLEPEDDVVPKRFIGTPIQWKEGRDVTVEEQKKRVKAPKVRISMCVLARVCLSTCALVCVWGGVCLGRGVDRARHETSAKGLWGI